MNEDKIQCYGKKLECPERSSCELGAPCLSHAREAMEDRHFQIQNIAIPSVLYDGHAGEDEQELQIDPLSIYHEDNVCNPADEDEPMRLSDITIPAESKACVLQVVERLAYYHFNMPNVLDALFNIIFKGKNQSDIAKEKNITRQCENKRLLRELGIMQKHNDIQHRRDAELRQIRDEYCAMADALKDKEDFIQSLSERDFTIFKYRFGQRFTAQKTAEIAGCDLRTVFRVSRIIRQKCGLPAMIPGPKKRKKCKKSSQ